MENLDNADLARLFPGEQFLGEPPIKEGSVKRFEMTKRQLAAREQLRARNYVLGNTFASRDGGLVELWLDRKAAGPTAMLLMNGQGGWELFCQPVISNVITKTWQAFDKVVDAERLKAINEPI